MSHQKENLSLPCVFTLYIIEAGRGCNIMLRIVEASWNVIAQAQKPDIVFRRNGGVHLNRIRWKLKFHCPSRYKPTRIQPDWQHPVQLPVMNKWPSKTPSNATVYFEYALICDKKIHNSKLVIFREKSLKVLKRYTLLWVQRRHNCSLAASFSNCVMTLYLLKVYLQTFLSIPITQKCQILSCDTLVASDCFWNVMAHSQKPDFVFRRHGWVHLNRPWGVSSVDCW